jgi:hypothetical protein
LSNINFLFSDSIFLGHQIFLVAFIFVRKNLFHFVLRKLIKHYFLRWVWIWCWFFSTSIFLVNYIFFCLSQNLQYTLFFMLNLILLLSKKLFFHSFAINVWSIFLSCILVQLLCTANISHIAHGSLRFSNHYLYKQIMAVSLNNLIYDPIFFLWPSRWYSLANISPFALTSLCMTEDLRPHPHYFVLSHFLLLLSNQRIIVPNDIIFTNS